jgi:hypothetical protein
MLAILKQWNDYLVAEALIPANQISTDDFAGSLANQTNLALKGIIGIKAMAIIAKLTGNTADATNFTNIAQNYITKWQNYGIASGASPPHTTLDYGDTASHGKYTLPNRQICRNSINTFRTPLQPLRRQTPRSKPRSTISLRHAKRILPDRSLNIRRPSRHPPPIYQMYSSPFSLSPHNMFILTNLHSRLGNLLRLHRLVLHEANVHFQACELDQ